MDDVLSSLRHLASLVALAEDAVNAALAGTDDRYAQESRGRVAAAGERVAHAARRVRSSYVRLSGRHTSLGWIFDTVVVSVIVGGGAYVLRVDLQLSGLASGLLVAGVVYPAFGYLLVSNKRVQRWRRGRGTLPSDWPAPSGRGAASVDAAAASIQEAQLAAGQLALRRFGGHAGGRKSGADLTTAIGFDAVLGALFEASLHLAAAYEALRRTPATDGA